MKVPPRAVLAIGFAALLTSRQFAVWTDPSQRFFYHWTRSDGVALVVSLLLLALLTLAAERALRLWSAPPGPRARLAVILLACIAAVASLVGAGGHPRPVIPVAAGLLIGLPLIALLGGDRHATKYRSVLARAFLDGDERRRLLLGGLGIALALGAWAVWPTIVDVAWTLQGRMRDWFTPVVWVALAAAAWRLAFDRGAPALRIARGALFLGAPLAILIALQAVWWSPWGPTGSDDAVPAAPTAARPPVVVVIFDEWSRSSVLLPDGRVDPSLPGASRVAAGTITFSGAHAPGTSTLKSVPRFLAQRLGELVASGSGAVWVETESGARRPWAEVPTLVTEARAAGYAVDIFGYYLPYSRLFEGEVRRAYSPPSVPRPTGFLGQVRATLRRSVYYWPVPGARELFRQVGWWGRPVFDHAWYDLQAEIADSSVAALSRLRRGEFLLLHLPTPHPPLVRGAGGERVDNPWRGDSLAWNAGYALQVRYTDAVLARLWAALGESGLRDSALVMITSDHAWRTPPLAEWMPAERFLQVPLWVRWPGGPVGVRTDQPVCLTHFGPLLSLAFRGDSALRAGGLRELAFAAGTEGCLGEPPPSLRVDWF